MAQLINLTDSVILCCLVVSCTHLLASLSNAQQVTCENAVLWVGVPEDEYDMSYSSINDPAGRPLGFNRSTIPYVDSGRPNPCISISGETSLNGRRIEVMAESNPPGNSVCVSREGLNVVCEDSQLYLCEQANGDTVKYVFHCSGQSCTDQDVPFLFRFTVSPSPDEKDPELWCADRNAEYPSSLAPLPPQFTNPPKPETTPSGSPVMRYHGALIVASWCLIMILSPHL